MKLYTKTLSVILLFIISFYSHAQQGNNWYFGWNAGLTFNTNPPSLLLYGSLHTDEGCAVISDSTGQLLFYTDGVTVYNRLHQMMPNGAGLMGHPSSANSAIIVPQPGDPNIYYIFTADAVDNSLANGYRYSMVDLSLNGGLGDVTTKNTLLYSKCTERLTATTHANGIDVWVITKEWGTNGFKVYKIDCNGLNLNPVISNAGIPTVTDGGSYSQGIGCTKVSPDGRKFATTRIITRGWEVFDFNNTTGIISNPIFIPLDMERVYGLEFSPDSKLIYIGSECCLPAISYNSSIHQYKIDIHDSATIQNSIYIVENNITDYVGALQLGPDNKIYVAQEHQPFLHKINNPNTYGSGCGFVPFAIDLTPGRLAQRGLPVFYNNIITNQNVDFTFTTQTDCRTVTFTGISSLPPPLTWSWDFGDGSFGTGQTVTHVFPTTGTNFNVKLTVTNPSVCGATATRQKNLSLDRVFPNANFGAAIQCGNLNISFTDSSTIASTNSIIAWQWNFGDGQISIQQNPVHTFSSIGQYNVSLIVTSNDGCQSKDTIIRSVFIEPQPVAAFNFDKGCLNTPVQFTDQSTISTGNITQWLWNFGDGQTSTAQNPQHTYTTNGVYNISLVSYSSTGCTDTVLSSITITPKPVSNFSFAPGCSGVPVLFTDNSTISSGNITSWYWNFGNGNTAITQNASPIFSPAANYTIKHVAISNGNCPSDTATQTIIIQDKPIAKFGASVQCGNLTAQFSDSSIAVNGNIVSWSWNFGDGNTSSMQNPQHTYTNYGSYIVKLTASTQNGCRADTIIKTIVIPGKPVVNFSLPAVCLLDAFALFNNTTTIADNSSLSYHWDFDDFNASPVGSDTSKLANPTYQYSAAAVYNIKLIATSPFGCSDSLSKAFTVNGAVPKADFRVLNPNNLCSNADVRIKDSSTVNFGNITRLRIFWGDGDSTIDPSPLQVPNGKIYNHRYAYFGSPATKIFTISMYSYSGNVCVDVKSQTITLYASPQILFNPIGEACKEVASFNITQASEVWGLPGTGTYSGTGITNPTVGSFDPAIADTGNHVITYTFITPQGCRADSSQIIRVNPTPKALFNINEACLPDANLQFTNQSSVPYYSLNQLQHSWTFNDPSSTPSNPNTSVAINPSHTYTSLNNYNVKLLVTSPKGCVKDTTIQLIQDVHIFPQPVADFILDSSKLFCQETTTVFINTSDSMRRLLTKWWWNFGDGIIDSVQRKPFHLYANAGAYTATLQIENDKGCRSTVISKPINIESIPIADFIFDTTCLGRPIQFIDLSTNSYGNIISWEWNFDDGNISILQNPLHTYTQYKIYSVTLIATTGNGCASIPKRKNIVINRVNIYAGNDTAAAMGQPLQLLATGAQNYTWSPSTGLNNPNVFNPLAILQSNQSYIIQGITAAGCIGYDTINIKVFKGPDIFVPTGFTPNGDGKNDYLKPICVGIKELIYFYVYNRWGQLVFKTNTIGKGWDGSIGGKQHATSTFVWMVKGVTFDGKIIEKKGTATLIR